jgi:hypothetical protein
MHYGKHGYKMGTGAPVVKWVYIIKGGLKWEITRELRHMKMVRTSTPV